MTFNVPSKMTPIPKGKNLLLFSLEVDLHREGR